MKLLNSVKRGKFYLNLDNLMGSNSQLLGQKRATPMLNIKSTIKIKRNDK
jgi:hypothetical protein